MYFLYASYLVFFDETLAHYKILRIFVAHLHKYKREDGNKKHREHSNRHLCQTLRDGGNRVLTSEALR